MIEKTGVYAAISPIGTHILGLSLWNSHVVVIQCNPLLPELILLGELWDLQILIIRL
jgi:hypothetical protein